MSEQSAVTFLFTDIEGSTRLWEQEPERMLPVMAHHDAVLRTTVERHRGTVVKMTGDGLHAAFVNPMDALIAAVEIQTQLAEPDTGDGPRLQLRCGLHAGVDTQRDGDFYGRAVNRAARIMCAAHGGQTLLSQAVADQVNAQLPEDISLRDLGTVRLRDLSAPEHLYQVQHPQLRADFPALRSLDDTPNNLTQQLNSFIGRERELAEIKQMLSSNRLVTLLGMGGIGKSRLSMQLAAEVLDDFPDGIWFVDLAAITDPRSVPHAVASVLGVKEVAGYPVIDALIRYVRERQLLIVLDNCEQIVDACAQIAKQLLQAGPRLKVLASSRDYLSVGGETTYQVPTLAVPNPRNGIDLNSILRIEAVRLFVDRASASLHGFGVNAQDASAIADICYCLDGIPLAIELAAARVRGMSVQTIAARLNDRFRLLTTKDQTVLPRQRTLRALIDWSYDLLTAQERALLQRLSAFAGGWTLDAAEAVCADEKLPLEEILDLLVHLVEKSLVVLEAGRERYRMLDTVRHYAQEKLEQTADETVVRDRHLDFYLTFAATARAGMMGPQQAIWLERLDLERENLLSAHRRCADTQRGSELDLRLASSLKYYWLNRGLLGLGHQVSQEALARPGALLRNAARSRGLCDIGQLCCFMGRYAEARNFLQESLAIARELQDTSGVAAVLQPLGMAALGLGDAAQSRKYLEEAVALARSQNDKRQLATAINALAQLYRVERSLENAETLYADAVSLSRELGDRQNIAIGLLNRAMVAIDLNSPDRAQQMLREVYEILDETGSQPVAQSALDVSVGLAVRKAQWALAARLYGAAETYGKRTGIQRDAVDSAFIEPLLEAARQAMGSGDFDKAIREGRGLASEEALLTARTALTPAMTNSS